MAKNRTGQISPSFIFPASEIIAWFHAGSHTSSTAASPTPGTLSIFARASAAIVGPMPQPGAVSVIFTFTFAGSLSACATDGQTPGAADQADRTE